MESGQGRSAPGWYVDPQEGVARPVDRRVSPAALRRLVRTPSIHEPLDNLPGLIAQVFSTAAGYPYLSVNAYNLWALVTMGGNGVAATAKTIEALNKGLNLPPGVEPGHDGMVIELQDEVP